MEIDTDKLTSIISELIGDTDGCCTQSSVIIGIIRGRIIEIVVRVNEDNESVNSECVQQ